MGLSTVLYYQSDFIKNIKNIVRTIKMFDQTVLFYVYNIFDGSFSFGEAKGVNHFLNRINICFSIHSTLHFLSTKKQAKLTNKNGDYNV